MHPWSFSNDCGEFLRRKSHVVASIFERDNGKKLYCLKQRRATFKARKFKPQIRGYHRKNLYCLKQRDVKILSIKLRLSVKILNFKSPVFSRGFSLAWGGGRHICTPYPHFAFLLLYEPNFRG